jgi:D-glycero-alpha-D-manno-heptose 1-phosphate guanylyltransferase
VDRDKHRVPAAIDVLILCGGLGSRLRPLIADRPKGLAPIGGKPFLDILVKDLVDQGFRRIVFCVGHMKEQIIERYRERSEAQYLFSQEDTPLGTGGALQLALPLVLSDPFLVMNGDSLCRVDFKAFLAFHRSKAAAASFVLARADERNDTGVVCLDEAQRVLSFLKWGDATDPRHCFLNAGIYLMQREALILSGLTPPFSLELDVFPVLVNSKPCFGFVSTSTLIDIGTPERYRRADDGARQR